MVVSCRGNGRALTSMPSETLQLFTPDSQRRPELTLLLERPPSLRCGGGGDWGGNL